MSIDRYLRENGERIWNLLREMNSYGARYTGNDAHRKYIQLIKNQLNEMKLPVCVDKHRFSRWEATRAELFGESEG